LCVCNFPANTGYAWDFIESVYAGLGARLSGRGVQTFVAYPSMQSPPRSLSGSVVTPVELDAGLGSAASLQATLRFVREHAIEVIYLCDQPAWNPRYAALRRAGVRRIVVHDHTSGARTEPRGVKRALKRARLAWPGALADEVVAVSDFVARRKRTVDLVPPNRVTRVWNSIDPIELPTGVRERLHAQFGIAPERPVIACAARATPEKGIATLLRAFDAMTRDYAQPEPHPVLLYMGDGPALSDLRALRDSLAASADIVVAGYVDKAIEMLTGAEVCVVPSIWEEAFGLAALEPMACGVPVIASRVGGIPEIVVDGETGRLVPPGDEAALARVMAEVLSNSAERDRLGAKGRERALTVFSRDRQLDELYAIVGAGFKDQGANE
jgi:glycosyltransferase involved in cell wall biosynthesis